MPHSITFAAALPRAKISRQAIRAVARWNDRSSSRHRSVRLCNVIPTLPHVAAPNSRITKMGKSVTDGNGTTTPFDVKGGSGEAMLFVPVAVHIDQVPL